MLHAISWALFARTILVLTTTYYLVISLLYYRVELGRFFKRKINKPLILLPFFTAITHIIYAQSADGNNGLNQANTMVRGYFDTATQLMYAVGAIMGLIGAVRVITKRGQDLGHEIAIWFGGCIFLVLAATVLKSFFGL